MARSWGGTGVGGLVAVVGLKAQGIPKQPQVAVGVHKTGQDVPTLRVQPLHRAMQLLHGAYRRDLSALEGHISPGNDRAIHGMDDTVKYDHLTAPFDKSSN